MRRQERCDRLRPLLLRWYRSNARDLPWRRTSDPYAIWISEIMLQQTRVKAVIPYYQRFMKEFPTVQSLADADIDTVLKAWEGLGYYSRGRNLHAAAKKIVADFEGKLPASAEKLRELPGIGPYTAGAISSIAFGVDESVVDGNVIRVLCRVFCIKDSPKETRTINKLWKLTRELLATGKAGTFNQALMELGAMVCLPRKPLCDQCPLSEFCVACEKGLQETLPVKVAKKAIPHYTIGVGVVWKGGRVLIDQRKHEGLLGGLWEFPGGKKLDTETLEETVVREVAEELGITVEVAEPLIVVNHAYSHFRVTLHVFECRYVSGRVKRRQCVAWKWVTLDQLDDYAFPAANKRIIAALKRTRRGE